MVKLINGKQPVIKRSKAQLVHGQAKRGVRAHQEAVDTVQKLARRLHLGLAHPGSTAIQPKVPQPPMKSTI
jgi:hypothetical protein